MRKIIYTAITGKYDTLKDPAFPTPGWEYVCYTTENLSSRTWNIEKLPVESDQIRQARKIKIMPPFAYDECIWVDGSIKVMGNCDTFANKSVMRDMMLLKHPHRDNIYSEAKACIDLGKDKPGRINRQINEYKRHIPSSFILPATGIIYRKNTPAVYVHSLLWLAEVLLHSHRDQLSFGYAAQKAGLEVMLLDENIYDKRNPFFLLHKHA